MHEMVATLTLEEKASLLSGESFWSTRRIERVGLAPAVLTDGPHGVRYQGSGGGDHLGLAGSNPSTAFPTAAATGSSWDPQLLETMGEALGEEARSQGVVVLLGPGINIKRSPLGGRNFEYFSEDPLLAGELGTAWVKGLQSQGVGASVKHFAANSQETERMRVSAEVDVDRAVSRTISVHERIAGWRKNREDSDAAQADFDAGAHHQLARRIAGQRASPKSTHVTRRQLRHSPSKFLVQSVRKPSFGLRCTWTMGLGSPSARGLLSMWGSQVLTWPRS